LQAAFCFAGEGTRASGSSFLAAPDLAEFTPKFMTAGLELNLLRIGEKS
jgi:hypothetical protein